mmetsp:Transcript_6676/g.19554  ORF Transcript_6676/g.19554 Transcript_6676/m.19554 type:complete len:327 (+) Transcript_6676:2057-3037(+)
MPSEGGHGGAVGVPEDLPCGVAASRNPPSRHAALPVFAVDPQAEERLPITPLECIAPPERAEILRKLHHRRATSCAAAVALLVLAVLLLLLRGRGRRTGTALPDKGDAAVLDHQNLPAAGRVAQVHDPPLWRQNVLVLLGVEAPDLPHGLRVINHNFARVVPNSDAGSARIGRHRLDLRLLEALGLPPVNLNLAELLLPVRSLPKLVLAQSSSTGENSNEVRLVLDPSAADRRDVSRVELARGVGLKLVLVRAALDGVVGLDRNEEQPVGHASGRSSSTATEDHLRALGAVREGTKEERVAILPRGRGWRHAGSRSTSSSRPSVPL